MTPQHHRIIVALDLSEYAEIVLEHALDQAARHEAPDLHFLTVVASEAECDDAKRKLATLVREGLEEFDASDWHARLHVRVGKSADEVANLAAEVNGHLIVIGRFGLHHAGKRLGSVASHVIEAAICPTLVVGLSGEPPAALQCAECVAVRAASDGERWFCAAHSATDREQLTTFVGSSTFTGGGLMW